MKNRSALCSDSGSDEKWRTGRKLAKCKPKLETAHVRHNYADRYDPNRCRGKERAAAYVVWKTKYLPLFMVAIQRHKTYPFR